MSTASAESRRHPFCEKHPVAAMVLFIFGTFFLVQVSYLIAGIPITILGLPADSIMFFAALLCLLILGIFKWWFRPDFEGCFPLHIDRKELLTLSMPCIIYWIAVSVLLIMQFGFTFNITLEMFSAAVYAGITEEILVRAVSIPIGMRFIQTKGRLVFSVVFTSVLFGALHSLNVLGGADLVMTVLQVIATMFVGLFLAAVFLRSGSIIPCMILHFFTDLVQFVLTPNFTGVVTYSVTIWNILDLVVIILLFGGAAFYFLRPETHDVIYAIWNKKWNRPMEACPLSRDE